MLSLSLLLVSTGLLLLIYGSRARWQERSRQARNQNKNTRKAHAIKNDIARDPEYRKRVRDHFDTP